MRTNDQIFEARTIAPNGEMANLGMFGRPFFKVPGITLAMLIEAYDPFQCPESNANNRPFDGWDR